MTVAPTAQVIGRVTRSTVAVAVNRPVQLVQFDTGMIVLYQDGVPMRSWAAGEATLGVRNDITTRRAIPTWAVVAAIVGALLCLLGLLFLLVKEDQQTSRPIVVLTATDGGVIEIIGTMRSVAALPAV